MAHILLIEDDDVIRETLSAGLTKAGHTLDAARDGKEGIAWYRPGVTDLVITDLIMPTKEGLETIAQLKKQFPAVKIIAISGGGRMGPMDLLTLARKMGANRIIEKPFTLEALAAVIAEVLG